jgi:dihydroorotate dehydrogenase (fumarate)
MDLTTTYMGLQLRSPLVPSASPLSESIDNIQQMEDAGAAAVVMHSLFEEQLRLESYELHDRLTYGTESYAEALTYFPETPYFRVGAEEYLNHISKVKEKVSIPIIASLNGSSVGSWTNYARGIEQAGADGLELNVYYVPTDMDLTGEAIEQAYIDILQSVKAAVTIPVAIKVSPFFTNMAHMAKRLDEAGASALVLFNRFYQPDIKIDTLEVEPNIILSTPQAMRLPLRWIAILYGRINASLAATSGIHRGEDVIKMLMAGANITMLCSVLLRHGINHLQIIEKEMRSWMREHEYESLRQLQGSMSQQNCPNKSAFERVQYMRSLQTYKPESAKVYESSHYFG